MREAYREGQSPLLDALEPIRERATLQQELPREDMERRWILPRRAAREERERHEEEKRRFVEEERRRRKNGDRPGDAA